MTSMSTFCCARGASVEDDNWTSRDRSTEFENVNKNDVLADREVYDADYLKYWEILPIELVIKVFSYLPTRDRFMMQYVCRRFQEIPLLWKEFLWLDYEPRHVCSVTRILKEHGEYVRKIFFPAHLAQAKILEMAQYCTQVTHLSLPRDTELTLDNLRIIVHAMKCLFQLDVFTEGNFMQCDEFVQKRFTWHITGLLEISATAASVKELNLKTIEPLGFTIANSIEKMVNQGYHLPTINIFENSGT